jgi:predicted PurR-regulated permease PerM
MALFTINSRNTAIAISAFIVVALLYYFRVIVSYVLIAWVVSMLGQPIMRFFKLKLRLAKFSWGNSLSALLTLIVFISIFAGIITFFVPLVAEQASNLSNVDYKSVLKALEEPLKRINGWARTAGAINSSQTVASELQHTLVSWLTPSWVSNLFNTAIAFAGNFIVGLTSVLFISFFFLKDQDLFLKFLLSFAPNRYEDHVMETVDDTSKLLTSYFGGILLQMLFVVIFLWIGLSIIGTENALLIAIFAAIINVVPYVGPILGWIFATSTIISSNISENFYNHTFPLIINAGILFGVMQFINDWIIQPYIFSKRVKAHPLEIFIVILIGAKLGGIGGMLLAIPGYTVLRLVARTFFHEYKFVQKLTDNLD